VIADRIRSIQAVSGGGGGGFDPSQLSGLKLWLKADTGVTVDGSGNVSSWADQSGNNNTAYQSDPTKYPVFSAAYSVNGVPAVVGQNDQFLQLTQNFAGQHSSTPFTVIWVGTKTNSTAGTTAAEALTGGGGIRYLATTTSFQVLIPNVGYANYGVGDGLLSPNAHFSRMDYPSHKVECTQGSSVVQNVGYNGFVNFARLFVGPTYNLTNPGYAINEVMLLDRSISDAELADIKDYIKTRYNLYTKDSLLLNMQGTAGTAVFTDESPNALTVTPVGDVELVADATFGTVASFDGAGDYLSISDSSAPVLGSSDWTIEAWIYISGAKSFNCIYAKRPPGSYGFGLQVDGSNNLSISVSTTGSSWALAGSSLGGGYTAGSWIHVAVVRSGTTITGYKNGVSTGTQTLSGTISPSTGYAAAIASGLAGNTSQDFNGRIGPFRITKGVARYTANFTPYYPGVDPYYYATSLILNMQGTPGGTTFVDESPNALSVTPYGNAQLATDATFGTVASFDGNGDYLSIPSNAAFNFGTGDFTVEFWFYNSNPATQNNCLISLNDNNNFYAGLRVYYNSTNTLDALVSTTGSSWSVIANNAASNSVTKNTWNHYAIVRSGSLLKTFLNGVQYMADRSITGSVFASSDHLIATVRSGSPTDYFNGHIGPLRITKGVARYTANFTTPTGLFPAS
jgi:hypothetical protein